ncbi:MAG TPA: zf-HC2 domain-containing protein [Gemmatimonadales bacterium]|jgi:anti-sigma factor RsiW|nr:zf-HC2 domain-containing protein [Gemmatimonadales bacterium]
MDRWTDRLSEYLDDTLTQAEREALDAHLTTCEACRETLDELRRVVDRARGLDDRPPTKDLWSGIATRIGSGGTAVVSIDQARTARTPARTSRRLSFSMPQAIAAGIALVLVSSGAVWLALRTPTQQVATDPKTTDSLMRNASWRRGVDSTVNGMVEQLRGTLDSNRSRLDTSTVRILEKNLAIIDSAIAQARRALDQDPGNNYLTHHLADTMRRKADLLRRASALGART